jgi:hypothetical protein
MADAGRSRLGLILAGVVGALALAIVAVWFFVLRDTAEPVDVEEVVTSFRTDTEPAPGASSPIPVGVYVYTTDGFESTDALTGVRHRYPAESTITVRAAECGATLLWRVLKGRSTEWTYCTTPAGWQIASQDERHTFLGRTEQTTYTCADTPIRPAGDQAGTTWPVSCGTDTSEETGQGEVLGRETLQVEGTPVPTVHVRKTSTFAGEIRGSTTHDIWFARRTGVPVKIVMVSETTNDSPIGDVHYEEDVTLALTSLAPRT